MKSRFALILLCTALAAGSCAVKEETTANEDAKMYLEALKNEINENVNNVREVTVYSIKDNMLFVGMTEKATNIKTVYGYKFSLCGNTAKVKIVNANKANNFLGIAVPKIIRLFSE